MTLAAAREPASRPLLGIAFMLLAMLVLSASDASAKWLSAEYSLVQIVFFRFFVALLVLGSAILTTGGVAAVRTRAWGLQTLRASIGLLTVFTFWAAVSYLPLAEVGALAFLAPLFLTALSVPLLGERIGPRRWLAILIGFLGVLLILRPGGAVFQPAALLAVAGALFYAITALLGRRLTRTETTSSIAFFGSVFGSVVTGLAVPFVWRAPPLEDLALFGLLGAFGAASTVLLVQAFRHAEAAVVAPYDYSALLWAILFGYLLFGDLPDGWTLAGSAVLIACGLYILHRETRPEAPPGPGGKGRRLHA